VSAVRLAEQMAATQVELAGASAADGGIAARLLAALPAGVVWIDCHAVVGHVNAAAVRALGTPLLGERWQAVVARQSLDADSGDIRCGAARFAVDVRPCAGGELIVLQDVSALRRFERARERRSIGRLAAGMAQVLRTELTTLQVYLDLAAGSPAMLERAQVVMEALTRHAEALLAAARGGLPSRREVDAGDVLAAIARQLGRDGSVVCVADGGAAAAVPAGTRVVANLPLLVDACLYVVAALRAAAGGRKAIDVTAGIERGCVAFRFGVRNDQAGRAPGVRALQPTAQVRAGLLLARRIVEQHGGEVTGPQAASTWPPQACIRLPHPAGVAGP
jgi:two-component system sensor histidine kinase FlrB